MDRTIRSVALVSCTVPQHYEELKGFHREGKDYTLTLSPSPTRPRVGNNRFRVKLTDVSGRLTNNAQVTFDYRKPSMHGTKRAVQTDEGIYEAEVNLFMRGDWTISVEIERPGSEKIREEFIIDAGPY